MFRPARLLMLGALGLVVYLGFFAVPGGSGGSGRFDPDAVATYEAAAWQALYANEDVGVYLNVILMLRERHQFTWFRALQAGYPLAGAMREFVNLRSRYERVLPDLVSAAEVDKTWRKASFNPEDVARAQLTWWVTEKEISLNNPDTVASLMAEELALRYGRPAGSFYSTCALLAQAYELHRNTTADPDWPAITRILARGYRALSEVLHRQQRAGV
jgi:hypothetical protein